MESYEKAIEELSMASNRILAELYDNTTVKDDQYRDGLRFASNTVNKRMYELSKEVRQKMKNDEM